MISWKDLTEIQNLGWQVSNKYQIALTWLGTEFAKLYNIILREYIIEQTVDL